MAEIWETAIKKILLHFLKSLKTGAPVNLALLSDIINKLNIQAAKDNLRIGKSMFRKANLKNLQPLKQLLLERNRITAFLLDQYKRFIVDQSASGMLTIGRRGQDILREYSLRTLERGYLGGNPGELARDRIKRFILKVKTADNKKFNELLKRQKDVVKAIKSAKKSGLITSSLEKQLRGLNKESMALHKEVVDKMNVFSIDGRAKFMLHVKPYEGKFKAFDVENYADLVGSTTNREAFNIAGVAKAEELGTRLVKWNFIGKNYRGLKDPCYFIDGGTYSTIEGGTSIGKKFFPYWKAGLTGSYVTPHPNCRHRLRPVSENLVKSLKPGLVAGAA